jgi:pimeloyl-ACP methyl ester carboxylesterase
VTGDERAPLWTNDAATSARGISPTANNHLMMQPGRSAHAASVTTGKVRVVLLPGAAGAASFWDPLIARLPSDWDLQAIDLPGLGSVAPQPDVRSYDDLVEYVMRALKGPSVVVAQSMGAYIALQLALRYTHMVTHLVLVAATGGVDVATFGAKEWRLEYATAFPTAADWARDQVPDLTTRLSHLAIPVLLIWATHDALSPLAVAHALAAKIGSPSVITFSSSDHWVVRRFADESAAAIGAFVV